MSFNGVLKSWGDLWIPPGGAFRRCCEVWSQSYSAATKLCIHKLWCLETRQGIEIIKVVMLSKQNLSMYHQLESCNKEGKKKKFIRLLHIRRNFLYLCIIISWKLKEKSTHKNENIRLLFTYLRKLNKNIYEAKSVWNRSVFSVTPLCNKNCSCIFPVPLG